MIKQIVTLFLLSLYLAVSFAADLDADEIPVQITDVANKPGWVPTFLDAFLDNQCLKLSNHKLWHVGKQLGTSSSRSLYLSCFDEAGKVPLWTLNKISQSELSGKNSPRESYEPWFSFTALDALAMNGKVFLPSSAPDGTRILFDRGHLVPNNDFRRQNDKKLTFLVINRAPQLASVNRGMWRAIEIGVRTVTIKKTAQNVYVITKLFFDALKTPEKLGGADTSVPTKYSKIVLVGDDSNPLTNVVSGICLYDTNRDKKRSAINDVLKTIDTCDASYLTDITIKPPNTKTSEEWVDDLKIAIKEGLEPIQNVKCLDEDKTFVIKSSFSFKEAGGKLVGDIYSGFTTCPSKCNQMRYEGLSFETIVGVADSPSLLAAQEFMASKAKVMLDTKQSTVEFDIPSTFDTTNDYSGEVSFKCTKHTLRIQRMERNMKPSQATRQEFYPQKRGRSASAPNVLEIKSEDDQPKVRRRRRNKE